jgi:bacteriorhodopsin
MAGGDGYAVLRHLKSQEDEYEAGSQMAQIFSSVMFGALTAYLIFSNSTRMSYIQRASLEKRLNTCCQINTIVAAISCFLNLFQMTEVDNWALPGQRQFTVDACRPIEWILTCPLMQLSLVLMGGSRIPEYRRVLMPGFAVVVLLFGSFTLFIDKPYTFIVWSCGFGIHCCAMWFNRLQILEHSKGVEGILSGDSEFRKATLILIGTWFPFPAWYLLSPEGFDLIDDITIIQMGWAFLNITAKFTLIFYIQRIKDNYCNRLKVTREMKGGGDIQWYDEDEEEGKQRKELGGDLRACVMETMNFLGMSENVERFLRLLYQAQVCTLDDVARLSADDCDKLSLPFDLVHAVQKRHKVWALEMVDLAERELEAGEKHYELIMPKKNPTRKIIVEGDEQNAKDDKKGDRMENVISSSLMEPVFFPPGIMNQPQQPFQPAANGFSNTQASPGFTGIGAAGFSNVNAGNMCGYVQQSGFSSPPFSAEPTEPNNSWAYKKELSSSWPMRGDAALEFDKLEQKLLERLENKLDHVIEAVGKKMEQSQEKFQLSFEEKLHARAKKSEETFGSGLKDVSKAVKDVSDRISDDLERSQTRLQTQIEQALTWQSSQQRDMPNVIQQTPGFM